MFFLDIGDIFDIEDCDFRGPPIFHPCPCLAGLYGKFIFLILL